MPDLEQSLRYIDWACEFLPQVAQDRVAGELEHSMKTFRDPGGLLGLRRLSQPILGRYCYHADLAGIYVQNETVGHMLVTHETYPRGLKVPGTEIRVSAGESIMSLHVDEGFAEKAKNARGSERLGVLLDAAHFSLGSLTYLLGRIPDIAPEAFPEYIVGLTYRQLACTAGYLGFRTASAASGHSTFYRLMHDKQLKDTPADQRKRMGGLGKPWLVYLPTHEFMERFPSPERPHVMSATFKVAT